MKKYLLAAAILMPASVMAQPQIIPYLGAQLHYSKLDISKSDVPGDNVRIDDSDYSYGLRAGAKTPIFSGHGYAGIELAYLDLGEATARSDDGRAKVEADGFELAVMGESEIFRNGYLYGRVGVLFWDADGSVDDGDGRLKSSDSDHDLTFGGGISYHLNDYVPLEIRAGVDRYRIDPNFASGTRVDLYSLGVYLSLR